MAACTTGVTQALSCATQLSDSLLSAFGIDTDSSRWLVGFILSAVRQMLTTMAAEPDVVSETVQLLDTLCESKERSRDRVFRAGLPQGSVLAPSLFLLWAAPLVAALKEIPSTTVFMYADDTATLCAGNDIATARRRAQMAADALVHWAGRAKMQVAGEKTQVLVLSQSPRDAADCSIRVAGEAVSAGDSLKLLGVTLERTLHFGAHCKELRRKTRPRIAQLRKLTGRNWGLEEEQLRAVASGYVRGPLEHAAAAWLPATPPSHVEVLEREVRAISRVVTGCPVSTRKHAVTAEAGQVPVEVRRHALAARFLAKARSLPDSDPLRAVADAVVARRLSSVTGWRDVGQAVWAAAGVTAPIEPALTRRPPPWAETGDITFCLDIGPGLPVGAGAELKKSTAETFLAGLPQCATWAWTDGSVVGGTSSGGAGALIVYPDDETVELRKAAGSLCSSFRAELVALREALRHLHEHPAHTGDPIVLCTDSQAALAKLRGGPSEQESPMGAEIWKLLTDLASGGRPLRLQWVPSHCGIPGNERADALAGEASALPQEEAPVDVRTVHRAAARAASSRALAQWPVGWYRSLMAGHLPPPVRDYPREVAIDIHQLLDTLCESKERGRVVIRCEQLGALVSLVSGDLQLPSAARRGLLKALVSVASTAPEPALTADYLTRLLAPLRASFVSVLSAPDFRQLYQEDGVRLKVLGLIEAFIGVSQGAQVQNSQHVFPVLSETLSDTLQLMDIYKNYRQIFELIMQLYAETAKRMLCFLKTTESRAFYDCCLKMIATYARHQSSLRAATSDSSAEEDSYSDLLLLMELLTNMLTKDIIDLGGHDGGSDGEDVAAADVCLYGLNTIMPLMSAELLRFPALCSRYFKLITFLCEITPTRILELPESLLDNLLSSVRLGLTEYGPEASALALDFLHQLTSHVVLHQLPPDHRVPQALRPFVKHLLDLILSNGVNSEVLQGSSGALFALICCFQDEYSQLAMALINSQGEGERSQRLAKAFTGLTQSVDRSLDRANRLKFRDAFKEFLVEIRGFMMVK
ncbi:Exportin-4 [Amphibalanus amphitrite]|uniref:Exportin-4 n=1 Tax=Amphibalanus amphitrite TaxID=1232801 RepID=A0A6A4WCC0_AMPAM|nr:Exportin-4 [Amphibalanus amphitrite]